MHVRRCMMCACMYMCIKHSLWVCVRVRVFCVYFMCVVVCVCVNEEDMELATERKRKCVCARERHIYRKTHRPTDRQKDREKSIIYKIERVIHRR